MENDLRLSNLIGQLNERMSRLQASTSDIGDWKIIKCYEATLKGVEPPYNVEELLRERQAVRNEINDLREQIKELEG